MIRAIGNIIWFICGGLITGLAWGLLGLLLCITIVGIPFGLQCFKFMRVSFFPFGKKVDIDPAKHIVANLLWALFVGWEMAFSYLVTGLICCITIIGIPNGIVAFKLMKLAFLPFGAKVTA